MERLLQPAALLGRIERWVAEEAHAGKLHPSSALVLREAVQLGEVERGRLPSIIGVGPRQARNVIAPLVERGVLIAATHRAPLRLAFPVDVLERWLPGVYPHSLR